ncbi:MAG: hypothetical protein MRK02_04175 [Candidatus Scalindua sp.]|nr:hypothetical protein [Candidatus Scalindua sp.]
MRTRECNVTSPKIGTLTGFQIRFSLQRAAFLLLFIHITGHHMVIMDGDSIGSVNSLESFVVTDDPVIKTTLT